MIYNNTKDYIKEMCGKSENILTPAFFDEHIMIVLDYCNQLSKLLNADNEIVCISALLHDVSAVLDFKTLSTHNIDSSLIAESFLMSIGYPHEKILRVKQCIYNHTSPIKVGEGAIEDVVLSNADAISQITNTAYWLYFVYKIRNMSFEDGKMWYLNKVEKNWTCLIEPAKTLIKDKYFIVKKYFS
jgi:HD superfamily phosphodiesterase